MPRSLDVCEDKRPITRLQVVTPDETRREPDSDLGKPPYPSPHARSRGSAAARLRVGGGRVGGWKRCE